MKHIVSFSGGKDSTAMLIRMLEEGMQVDEIIFSKIKATSNLGAELPEMYTYIEKINKFIKTNYNKEITILEQRRSFEDYFYTVKERGRNKGNIYGFPYMIGAWCNERLKIAVFKEYYKRQKEDYITYIGIAYDEPERLARLEKNERAPLVDWKMTEADCLEFLKKRELDNKLYEKFDRLGCWFCPKQSLKSLRILRNDYPQLWTKLLEWQRDSEVPFKPDYTIFDLEERFENEEEQKRRQINIFE